MRRRSPCPRGLRPPTPHPPSRLRPILLTTGTTIFGILPLLLERSFQARFLIPMAISLVFGLISSTVLTLFVLPLLYAWVDQALRARPVAGSVDHPVLPAGIR